MKTILILVTLFGYLNANAQSYFRKKYFVPEYITYPDLNKNTDFRKKSVDLDSSDKSKNSYLYIGKYNKDTDTLENKKAYSFESTFFFNANKASGETKYIKANIKANGRFLFVNPWLNRDITNRNSDFAFELNNRQQITLSYTQWTISPITVPVKIQFGKSNNTQFSSGISLGGLFGYSWGRTKFTYRKNLDNYERSHEFTLGGVMNFEGIEIVLKDKEKRETVSTSFGIGAIYSYDKINLGLTGGFEFAHGYGANQWDFQGRPWVGILLGYSLFE